jgi:hypothetical protein
MARSVSKRRVFPRSSKRKILGSRSQPNALNESLRRSFLVSLGWTTETRDLSGNSASQKHGPSQSLESVAD